MNSWTLERNKNYNSTMMTELGDLVRIYTTKEERIQLNRILGSAKVELNTLFDSTDMTAYCVEEDLYDDIRRIEKNVISQLIASSAINNIKDTKSLIVYADSTYESVNNAMRSGVRDITIKKWALLVRSMARIIREVFKASEEAQLKKSIEDELSSIEGDMFDF